MTAGHYRNLDMVTSSEPYVLARSATDGDDTLFAMHYHSPRPCAIKNAARYWTDGGAEAKRTYLAYKDATDSGPLRFSDLDCTPFDFTLDNAEFPVGYSPTGLIIKVGADLFDVDPERQTTKLLASHVEDIDGQRHLVRADGKLGIFDTDWALVRWVGDRVVDSRSAFGVTFFQDSTGIQRLTVTDVEGTRSATTTAIAPDACDLAILPELTQLELVAFYAPCADKTLVVWDAATHLGTTLELPAEPHYLKIQASPRQGHPNLAKDPYWALYLTDIDAGSATGTLTLHQPDGTSTVIGEKAALERADLHADSGSQDTTGGFALVDVAGETGRFVSFGLDGATSEIASEVIRRPGESAWSRLVIDVDGTLADLAEIVDGEAVRVAFNVPRQRYAYMNRRNDAPLAGRLAWFQDVDGKTGTLSLAAPDPKGGKLDEQGHEPLYTSTPIARGVYTEQHSFMNDLPGFVYFTHWDDASRTGNLEYSNVELGFTAIVSEGVGDFLQPGSGLLYSVPFGQGAGIWLARGK